ncbi:MAG: hypothetical protein AVDCRST_MAG71-2234, partial [uncultured Lysobacter sp.]
AWWGTPVGNGSGAPGSADHAAPVVQRMRRPGKAMDAANGASGQALMRDHPRPPHRRPIRSSGFGM